MHTIIVDSTMDSADVVTQRFPAPSSVVLEDRTFDRAPAPQPAVNRSRIAPALQPHPLPGDTHPESADAVAQALMESDLYREYADAFRESTGLPLALRPIDYWKLPHNAQPNENPFCALMASKSGTCSACMQVQQVLIETATHEPKTVTCPSGLCDTAVPVKLGNRTIAFLYTGQVFRKKPTAAQFKRTADIVAEWDYLVDVKELRKTWFAGRVLPNHHHDSVVQLLSIFAQHLSLLCNQILLTRAKTDNPQIERAKQFIAEHQMQRLKLAEVAKAVHVSPFHFCKLFKKATGTGFSEYLSRARVEKSKNLLLNPNLRVGEIAFDVGFQSVTHFNRMFKKVVGETPGQYRARIGQHA